MTDALTLAKSAVEERDRRIEELEQALRQAADVLATLTDPERIRTSRVQAVWWHAVAAEAFARAVLSKEQAHV